MTQRNELEKCKETFALAIAGADAMLENSNTLNSDIDTICSSILGDNGILGFYQELIALNDVFFQKATFMEGLDISTPRKAMEAMSVSTELFTDNNSMELKINNSYFKNHKTTFNTTLLVASLRTTILELKTTILAPVETSGSTSYYSFTQEQKDSLLSQLSQYLKGQGSKAKVATLYSSTTQNLSSELGESIELPSKSDLDVNLSKLESSGELGQKLSSLTTKISSVAPYSRTTSVNATLSQALNEIAPYLDSADATYNAIQTNLKSIFEILTDSSNKTQVQATKLRKLWIFWSMRLVNRPSGLLMELKGTQQAQVSLNSQAEQALFAIEIVAPENEYLPAPELICIYEDLDLHTDVLVFTALQCFTKIRIKKENTIVKEIPKNEILNGSEIRLGLARGSYTIQILRDSFFSLPSNEVVF